MTEFTSDIKTIPHNQEHIYSVLSNLNNLEKVKDKIPEDKVQDFGFDSDSVHFSINPIGRVTIRVIEREPSKTIKMESEGLPAQANLWIQLVQTEDQVTKMKLTVKAKLNPFIKGVVSKPLQQGLDKIAEMLAMLPYDEIK